jgi:hypothetical protein
MEANDAKNDNTGKEARNALHRGNSAPATPTLHFPDAGLKVAEKQNAVKNKMSTNAIIRKMYYLCPTL